MNYEILLKDKSLVRINDREYKIIKEALRVKSSFIDLGNRIISLYEIRIISPINEPNIISSKYQLKEGGLEPISKEFLEEWGDKMRKKFGWGKNQLKRKF